MSEDNANEAPDGMVRCQCALDCDYWMCVTCGCGGCKWPGACRGKCAECGGPARPCGLPNSEGMFDSFCSDECMTTHWNRAESEGRVVAVGDISPEQFNEMLNRSGLALEGIGERKPS